MVKAKFKSSMPKYSSVTKMIIERRGKERCLSWTSMTTLTLEVTEDDSEEGRGSVSEGNAQMPSYQETFDHSTTGKVPVLSSGHAKTQTLHSDPATLSCV